MLGVGGMGEVHSVRDELLGREVALKTLREDLASDASRRQFEHEFKLQARLEHPSIVPVYDIGRMPDGRTFFTMKKVRGVTLHEILERVAGGDEAASRVYPRRRLIEAVARATLAIDYAHVLGVVHRDLKPGNLMLGDFGEVYVLDWGIAVDTWFGGFTIGGAATLERATSGGGGLDSSDPSTRRSSQQIGTPGYAAPEQISGAVARVGARSDIWSLGAVLYEVLAGQSYVRGDTPSRRAAATIDAPDPRPSHRAADREVPPELDAICAKALAYEPEDRFGTAHELYQAIQRYLDGERDLELRAQLAAEHVSAADALVERALTIDDDSALADRAAAMKEIGRAMALAPDDPRALRVMVRLLSERPRHVPAQVKAEFDKGANELVKRGFQLGTYCYLSWVFCVPALVWMGLRDPWTLALFMTVTLFAGAYAFVGGREKVVTPRRQYGLLILTSLSLAVASRGFGPLVLVPTAIAVNMLSFSMSESKRRRVAFVAIGLGIGIVAPTLLEVAGVLSPSYAFSADSIHILPNIVSFPRVPTITVMLFANLAIILVAAAWGGVCRDELNKRDLELLLRKWHLAQILPEEPSTADLKESASC
ncbi:MAG: serine/threonine protein kinase [Deltaproteobacteria bacterium]|nr:serine/threonine protein kinase [Deltaproteobacteria bacterium]